MERLRRANLGIENQCLQDLLELIDQVEKSVASQSDPIQASVQAIAGFDQFLGRMITAAKGSGSRSLFEGTLAAARAQCGILFWCSP